VVSGLQPFDLPELTDGPCVVLRVENISLINRGSPKAFQGTFEIIADVIWKNDPRVVQTYTPEYNYIDKMFDDIAWIGVPLDTTYGGNIVSIRSPDGIVQDNRTQGDRNFEIHLLVSIGHDG
jgi:hypothetical protein